MTFDENTKYLVPGTVMQAIWNALDKNSVIDLGDGDEDNNYDVIAVLDMLSDGYPGCV